MIRIYWPLFLLPLLLLPPVTKAQETPPLPPIFRPPSSEEGPPVPGSIEPMGPPVFEGPPAPEAKPEEPPELKPDPILNPAPPPAMPEYLPAKDEGPKTTGPGFVDAWETTTGARILVLSIPAPRGQIVDRNGAPLAQNKVVYYLGVKFPYLKEAPEQKILTFAKAQVAQANATLGTSWNLDDDQILAHYKDRRWLPLIFSPMPLTPEQKDKIEILGEAGLELHPTYQRVYPEGKTAGHIVGFVGKRGPWAKGEIPDGEAMWPTAEGVRGLELAFEKELVGQPGRVQIIFDENGNQVEKTIIRAPVPGDNVITTLDLEMQHLAENIIAEKVKRGAFVIMDVRNGDILAMASYPSFDPNEYIPRISTERYNELSNDPAKPLYGRAFQGEYPPASTFKLAAGLGILESGQVDEYSIFTCPTSFALGNRVAHNWAKVDEGPMNIIGAITRSCNTWFYQAGVAVGSPNVTMAGQKLGYGERTGSRLPGESKGNMPTNEWHRQVFGYPILDGDLMNIVIGQGSVSATPLQTCQAMAAIGNRQYLHKARLVLQTQDYANAVHAFDVDRRPLNISQHNIAVIHKGMYDVVNGGNGTGRSAGHSRINISGKTGTGQWRKVNGVDQNLAWFSGFAPSEYPVYAFATLYEGDPGEAVSGGRLAAPIVGKFFEDYLTEDRLVALQNVSDEIRVATRHMIVETEDLGTGGIFQGAPPTGEETPPEPARKVRKPSGGGGGGFFKKLFNN